VSELTQTDFLSFLRDAISRGGFEADDTLAACLPLLEQTLEAHEAGLVAPLDGIDDVLVEDGGCLAFAAEKAASPSKNTARVDDLQAPLGRGVEVVAERRVTADVDHATLSDASLDVDLDGSSLARMAYLSDYRCWEHAVGHHDALTDIFSLGMVLGSMSCGLDFTDRSELEEFVRHRSNLFVLNPRLHPVVASVIVQMTELNRHKRAPDLRQLIGRLENYRDLPVELDLNRIEGFEQSGVVGKRRLIQSRLSERLFDLSRRNRLIYFKPTAQALNLTVASVPILLDYKNIKLEQLFVWHPKLAAAISQGGPISLGKYLRFEDAPIFRACSTRSSAKRAATAPSLALRSSGWCCVSCDGTTSRMRLRSGLPLPCYCCRWK
jgi:hypothetical protein